MYVTVVWVVRGSPAELLDELNRVAPDLKINTSSKLWPKDPKWLVRRLNSVKSNLQTLLGVTISIERDFKNRSTITIQKNISRNSGSNMMSGRK